MSSYDRYTRFRNGNSFKTVPFIKIPVKNTDMYEVFEKNKTKLDNLSYQYYDNANYAWFIMQANPEFGSMEHEIPDKALLRIPYPLAASLQDYEAEIDKYNEFN